MLLGIFSDIHFQPQGLDRIIKTGDWIIAEFERQQVQAVVCMGDALVTREAVDVVSQSAAINFFRKLADKWPVFLTLGNHDLNLKHATSVSSLDGLDMHPKIKVFREITMVGDLFLFLPYHEDQSKIVAWIQDFVVKYPEKAKNITVFGHLGINGAVQNTRYNTTFDGAMGPDVFSSFKRTYSGHFHVFQRMAHRVTYCGSPLQFNFGDSGDQRGIMVLDVEKGEDKFILNPHYDAFKVVAANELPQDLSMLKDCFVTVIYDDIVTDEQHQAVQNKLTEAGVIMVRKESVVEKAIREQNIEVAGVQATSAADLVEPFVKSVLAADSQLDIEVTVAFGKSIINEVNANFQDATKTGAMFDADIIELRIRNFFGIEEEIVLNIDSMAKGVWYLEGKNGTGKSTILEAVYWCYFGETIRNEMKADDVIFDPEATGKGKNCVVEIKHANGYSIQRFRKCNELGGSGVKVYKDGIYQESFEKGDPRATQKAIIDLIGIDAETYSRAFIMGQNITANFVTGDEKKRRAMIEEMLGLERFDAYLEKTRDMKRVFSDQLEQQTNIQRVRLGEIERATSQISSVEAQIVQAEREHADRLTKHEERKGQHAERIKAGRVQNDKKLEQAMHAEAHSTQELVIAEENYKLANGGAEKIKAEATIESEKAAAVANKISEIQVARGDYTTSLTKVKDAQQSLKSEMDSTSGKVTALEGILAQISTIEKLNNDAQAKRDEAMKIDSQIVAINAQAETLTAQATPISMKADKLGKLTNGGECPTCLTVIDGPAMSKVVDGLKVEVEGFRAQYRALKDSQKPLTEQANKLRTDAEAMLKNVPTMMQMTEARAKVEHFKQQIVGFTKQINDLEVRYNEVEMRYLGRLTEIQGVQATRDALEEAAYTKLVQDLTVIYQQHTARSNELFKSDATVALQQAAQALQFAQEAASTAKAAYVTAQNEKSALEATIVAVDAALAQEWQLLANTDPTAALKTTLATLVRDRKTAFDVLEQSKMDALNLDRKAAYVLFWDKAFAAKGSMRSFLLENSVMQLNAVIQSYIGQHFGGAMTLSFNSDLTYKQRYGRRSGGQRKWTDLAVLFSLFELARQRSRYRPSFLALDEVFDALDTDGRRAVQDLISTMAARVKRIFVITHVDVPGSSRAGTIVASMEEGRTSWAIKPV